MSSKAVRLCFVCVILCVVICAANPIGKGKPFTKDEGKQSPNVDVFMDVAKILRDANDEAKNASPNSLNTRPIKLRHNRHNPFARASRDRGMMKDAPNKVQGGAKKRKSSKPRDWRPEWDAQQPSPYNAYPHQSYDYVSHPYYNYHYSGYDNWYSNQIPNYHAYNVPPENEWRTTVHEGPDVEWTAHIAFPDMEPIIITNKNYTSANSNVRVIINKSEPKHGRGPGDRHVPVPGPRNVDLNAISSNAYSYSPYLTPSGNNRQKNGQLSYEPVTWTATLDYPHAAPVVMRGVVPQGPRQVHYVNPPPPVAGQGYYYPYNPVPMQWPAPAYNTIPWVAAPYPIVPNPQPAYQWPSVQVSYPSINTVSYPPSVPPHGGKPPLKSDDDDDEDDEDVDDKDDDENGNDDDDDDDDIIEAEDVDPDEEDSNEDETKVPDSEEASGSGDREDDEITTPKKGLFSWG